MDFSLLGPLEVTAAGQPLPLGGPKQRAILARLLVSANEVVSRATLVDDVWGEEPPAEVDATLRVYVARLRKILATENGPAPTLETRGNGYVLRLAPDALDLHRFERLVAEGKEALADGRPAEAAVALEAALALWRGPALVDLADDGWARRESDRLDELRLAAVEERVEADLRLGHHAGLVPELEALVAAEPRRERLVAQLMVALYRCGRQPDALDAYAAARKALHDDFGLEPTRALRELERQILVQDLALDADGAPEGVRRAFTRRRRQRMAAFASVVVAVTAAAVIGFLRGPTEPTASRALQGNSVVVIDQNRNAVAGEIPIGGRPTSVAVGLGSVWAGNRDDDTLLRIDPRARRIIETIGLGVEPTGVTVGGGSVWVVSNATNTVLEVDPATNDVVARIRLPWTGDICCMHQLAFVRGALWLSYDGLLVRVDRASKSAALVRRRVAAVASAGTALWAIVGLPYDRLRRLEPPGELIDLATLGTTQGVAVLGGGRRAVWTVSYDGTLARIDVDRSRVTASAPLGHGVGGLAVGESAIWLVTGTGQVLRADPTTGRLLRTIRLGVYAPFGWGVIAVGEGAVWVAALER